MAQEPVWLRSWTKWPRPIVVAYDLFEPTWSCEARERIPVRYGDGPKWVCGLDTLQHQQPSCLVYSFGSNGDVGFERAIKQRVPACSIYTFDPTLSVAPDKHQAVTRAQEAGVLTFVELGISDEDGLMQYHNTSFPAAKLSSIKKRLGHTHAPITLLKMDVEMAEHRIVSKLMDSDLEAVGQLQIEVHGRNFSRIHSLMRRLRQAGMMLFSKEVNHWATGQVGASACEMSFIGPGQAFRAFKSTHPSCGAVLASMPAVRGWQGTALPV
jgi:hypothetical protein